MHLRVPADLVADLQFAVAIFVRDIQGHFLHCAPRAGKRGDVVEANAGVRDGGNGLVSSQIGGERLANTREPAQTINQPRFVDDLAECLGGGKHFLP